MQINAQNYANRWKLDEKSKGGESRDASDPRVRDCKGRISPLQYGLLLHEYRCTLVVRPDLSRATRFEQRAVFLDAKVGCHSN